MTKNKNQRNSKLALGCLEAEIMEVLWQKSKCTVRDVVNQLKNKKAYTTVMTIMDRLYNKNILKRQMFSSGAYIYSPVKDRQSFYSQVSKKIISNLISEFGEVAVAQFIDVIESSSQEDLKEWKRKLSKLK